MKDKSELLDKLCEKVEKKLELLTKDEIMQSNIDNIVKLVDIKKDISQIKHNEKEEQNMYRDYYGNYDNYGARERDSRGRFMTNGYGGEYRGHEMLDNVRMYYGDYMNANNSGRYGSSEITNSLKYMLQGVEDFKMHLMENAKTEEERNMIRQAFKKMAN